MRSTLSPLSARNAFAMLTLKTRDLAENMRGTDAAQGLMGWLLRKA